jgi:rhodanese-related sulfurtransferase
VGDGDTVRQPSLGDTSPMEYEFESLDAALAAGWQLVDIRTAPERVTTPMPAPHRWCPLAEYLAAPVDLGPGQHLIICAHGVRSLYLTQWFHQQGVGNVASLRGGLAGLGIGT